MHVCGRYRQTIAALCVGQKSYGKSMITQLNSVGYQYHGYLLRARLSFDTLYTIELFYRILFNPLEPIIVATFAAALNNAIPTTAQY